MITLDIYERRDVPWNENIGGGEEKSEFVLTFEVLTFEVSAFKVSAFEVSAFKMASRPCWLHCNKCGIHVCEIMSF